MLAYRVRFKNLTVAYTEETARFVATMPWLYVAAGHAVGANGKAITDPKDIAAIEQVRELSGDVSVVGVSSSSMACSEVYATFVPKGNSWRKEPLQHSEITLNVQCEPLQLRP